MLRFQDRLYDITSECWKLLQSTKDVNIIPVNNFENSKHLTSFTAKYAVNYPNKHK